MHSAAAAALLLLLLLLLLILLCCRLERLMISCPMSDDASLRACVAEREAARRRGDFALADRMRLVLLRRGAVVEVRRR